MNGPYRVLHISLGVNFHPHEHPSDLGHFVENGAFNSGTKTNQWPAHIHAEYHLRPLSVPSGGTILPTFGWGKQSVWLAASGSQRGFRAEARTHFAAKRPKDREKKCMFTLCRDYDAVDKENDRPTEGRENRPCLPL